VLQTPAQPGASDSPIERMAKALALVACVFFALVAAWEVGAPPEAGHWAGPAAYAIGGENMIRYRTFAAILDYIQQAPVPALYYCHHPHGVFVLEALAHLAFGHHAATFRLPAIVCSALSAPLVYKLAEAIWKDAVAAAVATIAFVFVPVDLAFACFSNLEVPTIFFGLLFSWATVRLWETWRTRYLLLSIVGAFGAANCDWIGIVFVGAVAGLSFLRIYVLPRRFRRRIDERGHALWFAYATVAAAGSLVLYIALFTKWGHIGDLLGAYESRSTGADQTMKEVFGQRRHMWFAWMVTPLGAGIVAGALPLSVFRLRRGPGEMIPLAWTFMATFQYMLFKQGADIHIFWPHYYGVCVALGAATITTTLLDVRRWLVARAPPPVRMPLSLSTGAIIAVAVATPLLVLARMAVPLMRQGRLSEGRFDHAGAFVETEADVSQFTEWAAVGLLPGDILARSSSFLQGFNITYAAHRTVDPVGSDPGARSPEAPDRIEVVDARRAPVAELKTVATKYGVLAAGPFWRVDRAAGAGFRSLRYVEHQPGPLEWYFITGNDLVRTIGPDEDQWAAWEWSDHLGLDAASPSAAPGTFEELRVAHNVAIAHGDTARAAELRARVLAFMHDRLGVEYTADVHLLGMDRQDGPVRLLTLLWEAGEAYKPVEATFAVKCKVTAPPRIWPNDVDYFEKEMAGPMVMGPRIWKPGYLYTQRVIILHRIGTETCEGLFDSLQIQPTTGPARLRLLTLD
jgi:hypothetical protein